MRSRLLGGLVAEELAGPVEVDLGEGARVGGAAQQVLELVDVAEALASSRRPRPCRAGHRRRSRSGGPSPSAGTSSAGSAELVDLPAQVHVLEQLLGELAQLLALRRASSS